MFLLAPENAVGWLHESGRLPGEVAATAELLAWGVSNVVLRIEPASGAPFVLKQSRAQLRTEAEWFSRLERIWREVDVMRVLEPRLPNGAVPRVLFEDRENYVFGMQAVAADHVVWKAELLAGRADAPLAARAAEYLAAIHAATAGRPELQQQLGDRAVFDELRLDPFYRRIAAVHVDLQPIVNRLIDETLAQAICVVHADFSPKNLLIVRGMKGDRHRAGSLALPKDSDGGPVPVPHRPPIDAPSAELALVDYETGHYGDPAFDLGFFLAHLLLKTVRHAPQHLPFLEMIHTFLATYWRELAASSHPGLQRNDLSRRSVLHLGACLLARIDGKSTIDYLPRPQQQALVREFSRRLLLDPATDLETAVERLARRLAAS